MTKIWYTNLLVIEIAPKIDSGGKFYLPVFA
jgi:hypothetical protein